jgi:hypothetical protein
MQLTDHSAAPGCYAHRMNLRAVVLLAAVTGCGGAPAARAGFVLAPDAPADELATVRADPSIVWDRDGEEILALCPAGDGDTLVLTTHRAITRKEGWARAPSIDIHGHEEVRRDGNVLRLVGNTAIGSSSRPIAAGRCDLDELEALVAGVIVLRREGGSAAALLAHHQRLRERDERLAAERARRGSAPDPEQIDRWDQLNVTEEQITALESWGVTPRATARATVYGDPAVRCDPGPPPGCAATGPMPDAASCRALAIRAATGAEVSRQRQVPGLTLAVRCQRHRVELVRDPAGVTMTSYQGDAVIDTRTDVDDDGVADR